MREVLKLDNPVFWPLECFERGELQYISGFSGIPKMKAVVDARDIACSLRWYL